MNLLPPSNIHKNRPTSSQPPKRGPFDKTGASAADFDRDDEQIDLDAVGGYKSPAEGGDSDSDDPGSSYVPTAIAKRQPTGKRSGSGQNSSADRRDPMSGNKKAAPPPLGRKSPNLGRGLIDSKQDTEPKMRPTDPKEALRFDIEQEKQRIRKMENGYRTELDELRAKQRRAIGELEADHITAKKGHDAEKQRIEADKNQAIAQEKKRLVELNKIEMDEREAQYKKSLESQRALFEEQMATLGKQLKERVAINDLAKQISHSSGNIQQLRAKLDLASEGNLQRQEVELSNREKALEALRAEA